MMSFRNIAIIAHVDHGKTTLVDALLRQCRAFAEHEQVADRVMDSMDLERERGITIASKNTAVTWRDTKINIVDTPGHADFGGEVERVLAMVEGALLLVDASEGPLPQTRFVLRKAMASGLTPIVCINKIDRPDARVEEVLQEIYDLFIDLDADEDELDFPVLYACARDGYAGLDPENPGTDLRPLLDKILEVVPPPAIDEGGDARILVTNLDYDPYVGRLAIGRLFGAGLRRGQSATWFGAETTKQVRVQLLYTWEGLKRVDQQELVPGDIVAVAGVEGITVGDTLAAGDEPQAFPRIVVDEPTIGMMFGMNDSPLSGQDGKLLTSRQIRQRLERELQHNVSMRMEDVPGSDKIKVYGRGELQLCILIEQMRREGFELTVSRPIVVKKPDESGTMLEPWEEVSIDVPDEHLGSITQILAARKGEMVDMQSQGGRTNVVYNVPSRGLLGFRNEMLTETRGQGVTNTRFVGWRPDAGEIPRRARGAIVADRKGKTTAYALFHLQPRGTLFVAPGIEIYEGMIVGIHTRDNDLNVNASKEKQLTNVRSSGADEKLILSTPKALTLESAVEFIDDDERVEITPSSIRLRKAVLATNMRSIVRRPKPPKS